MYALMSYDDVQMTLRCYYAVGEACRQVGVRCTDAVSDAIIAAAKWLTVIACECFFFASARPEEKETYRYVALEQFE